MGTELNANITSAKRASELTKVTGNLNSIYSKSRTEQKEALSELFKQKYFNSTTEKATIEDQIETLEAKIKEFDKKIKEIEDKIADKQDELESIKSQISGDVAKIVSDTEDFEENSKRWIDTAISNAQYHYENDSHSKRNGGEKTLSKFIAEQMNDVNSYIVSDKSKIDNAINNLTTPQTKLNNMVNGMEGLLNDIDGLNSQYATTKSTLDLLKLTKNNMTDAAGSYQTSDTDPSVPIFTPAKEDLADGYLAQYTSRMANRDNQTQAVTTQSKDEVKEKYSKNIAEATPGADPYSANNAQLKSFSEALDNGLITDMQGAGFTKKEMLDTVKELYPSIGISHGDDGRAVVPYGHGTDANAIYTKFLEGFGAVEGGGQRDDLQVAEMDKAINGDKIITEMKNNDFSWKETAYTLTRLWPGGGIGYNLGEKEITLPIGDDKSKGTYDSLEAEIKKNYPDVTIKRGVSDDTVQGEPQRTDPVGFHIGDNSYEFAIDRNQDGVLNDFTEMVGANGDDGMEELWSFADENGIIQGENLDKILILNTEHTNRDYEFLTASQFGIESIDLKSFTEKTQDRPDGTNGSEDFININNSLITGTFDVNLSNGQTAEGYQKYVTEDYMKAVYDPILGENIYSELDGNTVDNTIDKNFKEAGDKLANINEFADLIQDANGYGNIKSALRTKLNNAQNEAYGYKNQKMAENISNYEGEAMKVDLEMSLDEADRIINEYLEAEDKKKNEEK